VVRLWPWALVAVGLVLSVVGLSGVLDAASQGTVGFTFTVRPYQMLSVTLPTAPAAPIIVNVRSNETYTLGYRLAVQSDGREGGFGLGAVEWVLFGPAAGWPTDDIVFVAVNHPKTGPLGDYYAVCPWLDSK